MPNWLNRFRSRLPNASRTQPDAPPEDISDSLTVISFRMPQGNTHEHQRTLAVQRSLPANVFNGIRPRTVDAGPSRVLLQRGEEDSDYEADYSTELPADGTNHSDPAEGGGGGGSRERRPFSPYSTISSHGYEQLRNINEGTPEVDGHHAVQSVGSESTVNVFASLELRSDRTGNRAYPDREGRSQTTTHNLCTLCQNHIEGSVSEEQGSSIRNEIDANSPTTLRLRSDSSNGTGLNYNPEFAPSRRRMTTPLAPQRRQFPPEEQGSSRNGINENIPTMFSLRSDSSNGIGSNHNPEDPHSRRRVPAPPPPPPPQQQQQQQHLPSVRPSFRRGRSLLYPLRSEDVAEHIPYYRETGFSNDGHALTINVNGPITIHTHSFSVSGGQLNAHDEEIAVDGLERPLNKTFYHYINNACQRYLQQMTTPAGVEPSS